MMQPRALGRLLRISLLPSALADVAAGLVVGGRGAWPQASSLAWLFPASLCIFHGGLALNDWVDRAEDARIRPDRPIPSGAVGAGTALVLAAVLLVLGALLGALAGPRLVLGTATLALLAAIYDCIGRGAFRGPLLLGACRATNLGIALYASGRLAASEPIGLVPLLLPALVYGAYVFTLSTLARLEDAEHDEIVATFPRRVLLLCALFLCVGPFTVPGSPPLVSRLLGLALAASGAFGLVQLARSPGPWTRGRAGAATGATLRRLLVLTSALSLAAWHGSLAAPLVAAAILCGYPVSFALRRVFPPT
jgi:4-hydroxybenzoate polyprenyltransferase